MAKIKCQECDGVGAYRIQASADAGTIQEEQEIICSLCDGTGTQESYV